MIVRLFSACCLAAVAVLAWDTRRHRLRAERYARQADDAAARMRRLRHGSVWMLRSDYWDYGDHRELAIRLVIPVELHDMLLAALHRNLDEGPRPYADVSRLLLNEDAAAPASDAGACS